MSFVEELEDGARSLYEHIPHPRHEERRHEGPVRTEDHRSRSEGMFSQINARLGLLITVSVGTMWAAYIFTAIALVSLPSAISSHNLTVLIAWVSSNFLQLTLLPIVIVGQNLQARASDARAEQTFRDAEATLHESSQIQEHLAAQDAHLLQQDERLAALVSQVADLVTHLTPPTP